MESQPDGNVLSDFWEYCSCYEIPRNYALWSAVGLLGAVVNRKIYLYQGDILINATEFIVLVGPQGNGKSTAMRFAKNVFVKACPNINLGPSQQSREDIVKFMSSEDCMNYYDDAKGQKVEYRPYHFFINEFKNFVSYNPAGMIAFLTDIYDEEVFKASTIKRGLEDVVHPAVNILACENPDWMIKNLKNDTISGGFSRRINFIYVLDRVEPRPRPFVTPKARAAIERVLAHCIRIKDFCGEVVWSKEAEIYYDKWYITNRSITATDSIMAGYYQTKHIQMLKVCMLLLASEYCPKPSLLLTVPIIERALALMEAVETNLPKLFVSAGRNELAAPQQKILDLIEAHGGMMAEREILKLTSKDLSPSEQIAVLGHLKQTQELYRVEYRNGTVTRWVYMSAAAMEREKANLTTKA